MKNLIIPVVFTIVLLTVAPVLGQTQVVSMEFNGWPNCFFGEIVGGVPADFDIRLINQNEAGCSYYPSCAWVIEGLTLGSTVTLEVVGDLANWDYRIFNSGASESGVDTVGIVFTPSEGPGPVYDGFDDVALRIHLQPKGQFGYLYVRALGSLPAEEYAWEWAGAEGCANAVSGWQLEGQTVALDTDHTYRVILVPDCYGPQFVAPTPDTIYGAYCETLTGLFVASDDLSCGEPSLSLGYEVRFGPGSINPSSGVWTWDGATQEDISQPITLSIWAWNHFCTAGSHTTTVIVTDKQPLTFTSGCNHSYFIHTPETRITFTADADCPANPLEFFVFDDGGMLGECFFEANELVVRPSPEMLGDVQATVGVTDGLDTMLCGAEFLFACCYGCCGQYTGGFTGNTDCDPDGNRDLADITRLVDYVYISHDPLCCHENGNTDGDPDWEINLSDITRLIDNVYISRDETAACQ